VSLTHPRTTRSTFAQQAREHLGSLRTLLAADHPPELDVLQHATGATRSLRGNASLLGLDSCQGFLGRMFHLLEDVTANEVPWSSRLHAILQEASDVEERYVEALEGGETNPRIDELSRLEVLMASWKKQEESRQDDLGSTGDNPQRPESQTASPEGIHSTLQTLVTSVGKLSESAQKKRLPRDVHECLKTLEHEITALQATVATLSAQLDTLPDDSETGLRNHCEGGLHHLVESAAQEVLEQAHESGVRLAVRATGSLDIDEDELGGAILEVLRNLWSDSLAAQAQVGQASIDTVVRVDEERLLVEVRDAAMSRDARSQDDDVLGRYAGLRRLRPLVESLQGLVDVEPARIEHCRFRVSLPRTRRDLVTRVFRVGTHEVAIPASAIDSVHAFESVGVSQDVSGALVEIDGRSIPLVHLAVLRSDPSFDELARQYVVVIGSFERRAAFFASGPARTLSGTAPDEPPTGWLSDLQSAEGAVELLDPGALLGRRKLPPVREESALTEQEKETTGSTLFVTRESEEKQELQGQPTVLIVNSSEVEGTSLRHLLQGASFRALSVRTGTEALEILARESIQLLICDLRLPEMNAQQISEHRKENGEFVDIPVLLVLSHVGDQGHLVAQQLGAADFVRSPVDQDEFVATVRRLTDVS
jgi:CheY-like chemotaxis protein